MEIKLSNTSKMPCHSFSIPAQVCKTGSKLAKVPGSVCHGCYALKGFYRMNTVQAPRQANLETLPEEGNAMAWIEWADKMAKQIAKTEKSGFFRWHDSGDMQCKMHLAAIVLIANLLPNIKFWLPTKEKAIVSEYIARGHTIPDNLVVRVSSAMIDQKPVDRFENTCTVHQKEPPYGVECQAYKQGGKCGECRSCWDKAIPNISYPLH